MSDFHKLMLFDDRMMNIECQNEFESTKNYPQGLCGSVYTMPEGFDKIGTGAFARPREYTEVVIPEGVLSIGRCSFLNASTIEKISFPKSLRLIKAHAFGKCSALTELEFSGDDLTICEGAFWGCKSLVRATFSSRVTRVASIVFNDCRRLEEIVITPDVKELVLGPAAFYECRSIKRVILPEGLKLDCNAFDFSAESKKLRDMKRRIALHMPDDWVMPEDDNGRIEQIEFIYTDSHGNEASRVTRTARELLDEIYARGEEPVNLN